MNEKHKKAVALKYTPEESEAPIVLAKGKGDIAKEIIRIAVENNIPIVEDEALVNALIKLDLYEEIPPELYEAVAEILIYVIKKIGKE